jgi:predicted aldo/keto reductase-like oxidoreductase
MRLPTSGGQIDERLATAMVRHAIDRGVNYVDTAWPYHDGQSEPVVGRILRDGYREKVNLATKLPAWLVHSRADAERYLTEQLKRLQTDHLEFYLVHAIGKDEWDRLEREAGIRSFLEDIVADGRASFVGFSSHEVVSGMKQVVDAYDWDFCQIQYNYLDENYQAGTEGLEHAAKQGLGVVVMEPLRGGWLTRELAGMKEVYDGAPAVRSAAEWALHWVFSRPEVTVVLSGMSNMAQVEENLRIAEAGLPGSLTRAELVFYEKLKSLYRARMKVDCTTCAYCMPCPSGVNIPECFACYNAAFMFDDRAHAQLVYGFRTRNDGGASACNECGTCEEHCPQGIPIAERLKDVAAFFGR